MTRFEDIKEGRLLEEMVCARNAQLERLTTNGKTIQTCIENSAEAFDALLDIWNAVVWCKKSDEDLCFYETNAFAKAHNLLVRTGLI